MRRSCSKFGQQPFHGFWGRGLQVVRRYGRAPPVTAETDRSVSELALHRWHSGTSPLAMALAHDSQSMVRERRRDSLSAHCGESPRDQVLPRMVPLRSPYLRSPYSSIQLFMPSRYLSPESKELILEECLQWLRGKLAGHERAGLAKRRSWEEGVIEEGTWAARGGL